MMRPYKKSPVEFVKAQGRNLLSRIGRFRLRPISSEVTGPPHLVQTQAVVFAIREEVLDHFKTDRFSQFLQLGSAEVVHIAQTLTTLAPVQQVITGVDVILR